MKHTPISSSQSSIGGLSSDFVVFLKTLIISSSEIVCTGSELILTSSELILTSSELISTSSELIRAIAEQILTIAQFVVQTTACRRKNKLIVLMQIHLLDGLLFNIYGKAEA